MENNTEKRHCLNCNTELQGEYCHVCGQHDTSGISTVKGFFLEYLNVAYMWDPHFFKTIWNLIRRPGYLTREFVSGKYVAYTHPLKFNMFLLFVFLTMFVIFSDTDKVSNTIEEITQHEVIHPILQADILANNQTYSLKIQASKLDTIQLYAPLQLAMEYPTIATYLDIDANDVLPDSMAVRAAAVPHLLIEDEVIVLHEDGYYYFGTKDKTGLLGTTFLEDAWKQMVALVSRFFPFIILLTAPLLSIFLQMMYRKSKHNSLTHFIFTLHYISFIELLVILIYILHLVAGPPTWLTQWIMILGTTAYLVFAVRNFYETRNWFKATAVSICANAGYAMILLTLIIIIIIIACAIVICRL